MEELDWNWTELSNPFGSHSDGTELNKLTLTELLYKINNSSKLDLYNDNILQAIYIDRAPVYRYRDLLNLCNKSLGVGIHNVFTPFIRKYINDKCLGDESVTREFLERLNYLIEYDINFMMKLRLNENDYKIIESYCIKNSTFAVDVFNKLDPIVNKISITDCINLMKDSSLNIHDLIDLKDKIKMDLNFTIKNYKLIKKLSKSYNLDSIVNSIIEVENEGQV